MVLFQRSFEWHAHEIALLVKSCPRRNCVAMTAPSILIWKQIGGQTTKRFGRFRLSTCSELIEPLAMRASNTSAHKNSNCRNNYRVALIKTNSPYNLLSLYLLMNDRAHGCGALIRRPLHYTHNYGIYSLFLLNWLLFRRQSRSVRIEPTICIITNATKGNENFLPLWCVKSANASTEVWRE